MIVGIDFETYYSREYSLRKMSELEYILSPEFETIGCSVKVDREPAQWYVGHQAVAQRLAQIDWSKAALLSHNTRFDGAILHWHYGIKAGLYLDTLSMARAMIHCVTGSSSLATVAKYLRLGAKGNEVVHAIGKRLRDFSWDELRAYGGYCNNDNELCRQIFDRLAPRFPRDELRVIDLTQRMYIFPQLRLNREVLQDHLADVQTKKADVFAKVAAIDKSVFSSNQQFAELLESHGVDVPMKPSTADPNKMIPALARNDRGFKELCEDESLPFFVQALLAARREAKSTIEESRTEKMLAFSKVRWPDRSEGRLPVPLRYFGAHTGRFSGDGGFNMQNLRRDSAIRRAIEAEPGYVVVTRDASQIEARMVAWLAGQADLIADFAAGVDIYSKFASTVFGRPVTKNDKVERFIGKTCILGLGYGMGAKKFAHTLYIGQPGISVTLDPDEATRIVYLYRKFYSSIPQLWNLAGAMLSLVWRCSTLDTTRVNHEIFRGNFYKTLQPGFNCLWLPNGMPVAYPGLRPSADSNLVYDGPYHPKELFGGKVVENVSQALARIVITDIMRRVWDERRVFPVLQVHDSLAYVVPESEAAEFDQYLATQFAVRPSWAPDLPLASEGGYGPTLAAAEGK